MICYRCQGNIHSGKIEKTVKDLPTTYYCRHCYQALKQPDGMAQFIYEENNG